ncbi:MAPEG family protein [Mesorhizobium sp. BE184]|uniref:MAPEG family protein n=1 Tax=Mesorhizobium sp. BE184 TaxID=2817714 RepID=UPI00285CC811|nr:MAPEG family protein [Mesorhizobium sp. BE184]MDR7032329.1 hypothetical protein [Mesorhizobium sp. BE184]
MSPTAILWPMLAHVLLVYMAYLVLGVRRRRTVMTGATKVGQFKVRSQEPEISATAAANVMNQFELPVLLYALCLALYVTDGVSYITLALTWIFVAIRYFHAWVHLTSNDLRLRSGSFALGFLVLGLGWIWLALHILGIV